MKQKHNRVMCPECFKLLERSSMKEVKRDYNKYLKKFEISKAKIK